MTVRSHDDVHSPWQRGSNENLNGPLRQYFPKASDLSIVSYLSIHTSERSGRGCLPVEYSTPQDPGVGNSGFAPY